MKKISILIVFGTRPEAIKMAPIVEQFKSQFWIDLEVCATGQHRELLDPVLRVFEIVPDYDLHVMKPDQSLNDLCISIISGLTSILKRKRYDWVFVQGDTTTALATSIAAFHHGSSVAHVEAGLRTGNKKSPWPEEVNRQLISRIADVHFAPTEVSKENLISENVDPRIVYVTGNTVIDALLWAAERARALYEGPQGRPFSLFAIHQAKKLVLVTGHRRENFGAKFENIMIALTRLASRDDLHIVFPVHLNPNVKQLVHRALGDKKNITLTEPLDYLDFVYIMQRSYMIISDSGGIQEEAPSLDVPVLVTRDTTERPEALNAGTIELVGTDADAIFHAASHLLDDEAKCDAMKAAKNPYGDGTSAKQIVEVMRRITNNE